MNTGTGSVNISGGIRNATLYEFALALIVLFLITQYVPRGEYIAGFVLFLALVSSPGAIDGYVSLLEFISNPYNVNGR